METRASELRELGRELVKASYLKGDFVLRSGKRSNRYFDKFLFETDPAAVPTKAPIIRARRACV
ncbi:MAG TPA: hypothetical protein VIN12_04765, partial [Candidatus Dormibacteraeota bacterium]